MDRVGHVGRLGRAAAYVSALSLLALAFSLIVARPQAVSAFDSRCSPDLARWYGIAIRNTASVPMKGGHGRIEKVPMTPATNGVTIEAVWVYTTPSLNWWAEIDYGYNVHFVSGPAWYYYYFNGTGEHWGDSLPFNAAVDYAQHDVTIKLIGSGQWYGYIDGAVAMLASDLGDGVYRQDIGAESASCLSYIYPATLDNFTSQNWDDTWTSWLSGTTRYDSPMRGGWLSYPTSSWAGLN